MKTGVRRENVDAIRASNLFDAEWYLRSFPDVGRLGMDPAEHYLWIGARLKRNPSAHFDTKGYLDSNQDVAESGINPLLHFEAHGRAEGRNWTEIARRQESEDLPIRHVPLLPADLEAEVFRLAVPDRTGAALDVVIPVYRSRTETLSCIWHVLKSRNATAHDVVVIDDCSPEPELSASLARIAEAGYITLLRQDSNQGFVRTANRGMRVHEDRDVILLNSDTEVYGDWIDRLRRVADAYPECGTVTPLTNSGTICSYPYFVKDNRGTLELPFEDLDRIAADVNGGEVIEAPTAVGFCMYIKREMLQDVGYFDEEAFGRGYGEENDFCQRGQMAGWKDLIAANIVVRHLGGASFRGDKAELVRKNLSILASRYPGYHERVRTYIQHDPARHLRAKMDLGRLRRMKRDRSILIISHQRGGGVERCVRDSIRKLTDGGASVFLMRADRTDPNRVLHAHPNVPDLPNLDSLDLAADADRIVDLWNALGITEVHVHHVIDYGADGATKVRDLLLKSGRQFQVTIHDYLSICPRISLSDETGFYCGEPEVSGCNQCLRVRGSAFEVRDIEAWRSAHGSLLKAASVAMTPDVDVAERMRRYFPDIAFHVIAHEDNLNIRSAVRSIAPGGRMRVGTLGGISDIKGFQTLLGCAEDARSRGLPIDFVVVGHTMNDAKARASGIEVSGPYRDDQLQSKIASMNLDAILLLSTWPETYSYTLSAALQTDLPIAVLDIGAPARRVRGVSGATALPLSLAKHPRLLTARLVDWLCCRDDERNPAPPVLVDSAHVFASSC